MGRRREDGAGGVYKRGRIFWIWYRVGGERFFESSEGADRRAAQSLLAQRRRELRDGTWQRPEARSVTASTAAYLDAWIARRREAGVRNVADEARWIEDHVKPAIGSLPLASVQRAHVRDLVASLRTKKSERTGRPYAPRTILHVYRTLVTAFGDAQLDGLIAATPCTLRTRKGELPKLRDADPKWRANAVYTREEAETLLASARVPLDRRVLYALMLGAGLRFSEAAGLRWAAYDATAVPLGRLVVEGQADGTEDERETKTGETREVPVIPALASLLAEWREAFAVRFGYPPRPEDPIVPSTTSRGRRYTFRSTSGAYESLVRDLERLGLRRVPALRHSMRATFLTLLEADGANMAIAARATHASPKPAEVPVGARGYFRPGWADLCREVGKLRLGRPEGFVRGLENVVRRAATEARTGYDFGYTGTPEAKRPRETGAERMGDTGVEPHSKSRRTCISRDGRDPTPSAETLVRRENAAPSRGETQTVTHCHRTAALRAVEVLRAAGHEHEAAAVLALLDSVACSGDIRALT